MVGSEWQCTNGILQGCGVSVVLLNALVTLWLHAVSVETPVADSIKPGGYADDIHAVSKTAAGVQRVHNITAEYASLSGQEISHDKSVTFAVTPPQRRKLANVMLEGRKLAVRSNVDILGVSLVMAQSKQGKTGKTAKAMKSASKVKKRLQRLQYAPLDFESKADLAGTGALSPLMYGQAGRSLPKDVLNSLRRASLLGIWKGAGNLACAEVAFTLLLKGHRVDPVQVTDCSGFAALCRTLAKNPEAAEIAYSSWLQAHNLRRDEITVVGPVTRACELFASCRWRWTSFRQVRTHTNATFALPSPCQGRQAVPIPNLKLQHELREALRRREWREAARRRNDMRGIENGIDRAVSTGLHERREELREYQRACLRAILTGAVYSAERHTRHKTRRAEVGTCPYCGCDAGETVFHRWWVCPQWQHLRAELLQALPGAPIDMPTCLAICGLLPETGAEQWKPFVEDIQRVMLKILCQHNLSVSSQRADAADDDAGVQPGNDDDDPNNAAPALKHKIVRLPGNKYQCTVCKRITVLQFLARLRESPCRGYDISDSGATPSSLSRCNKNWDRLLAEWSEKKPGGHALTWSGNVNDCIVCTVCTRKWPYSGGRMPWKTQIYQACPGNAVLAEQTRCSIRKEVSAVRYSHSLFLNLEVDKVECKKCHKTSAFHTWKALAKSVCKPTSSSPRPEGVQQARAKQNTRKGRGRSAPSAVD